MFGNNDGGGAVATHTNCPFILQFFELSMSIQYSSKVREREKDEDRSRVFDIKSIC